MKRREIGDSYLNVSFHKLNVYFSQGLNGKKLLFSLSFFVLLNSPVDYEERKKKEVEGRKEWISVLGLPIEIEKVKYTVKALGITIDFYPLSDTYYRHDTMKYGVGISELCQKIKNAMEKKIGE